MTRRLDFRLLGPLEVLDGDRSLPLGGRKQRTLLAILLLHANEVVSSDALIDGLWGERVPKTAPTALQVSVSNLRKLLSAKRVETRSPGYVLRVEPDELDLARFEQLCREARGLAPEAAAAALAEALALWHGQPLADFAYDSFAQSEIARLEELRLSALEQRIEAELELGRHADLSGELESLVADHPLRERLRAQLILSLYRSGRQVEALEAYRQARTMLVEDLGIEPGAALKELERAILAQDAALEAPVQAEPAQSPAMAELPTGTVTLLFTDVEGSTKLLRELGRERYMEALDAYRRLLREACSGHRGVEVEMQGDSFHFAFQSARGAVEAAAAAQRTLAGHAWPGQPLRVRIGLHTGEPAAHGELYAGLDVHRAARIMGAAAGGQVLLSQTTRELLAGELELRDLGEQQLKDLKEPERLYELVLADGEPVPAAVPVREERKRVSVLFAQLAGLYSGAASSDPEDLRAAIGPYEARVREEIERYGGTVERFVGETVMAVFGAAVAHEDDAERAVRAALALAEALGGETELTVRAAVATGQAVVSVAEGASAIVGEVVDAAVQLKEVAPEGGVVVEPLTYEATKQVVDFEQLEKPGRWRAVRPRSAEPHRPGSETPFVGRTTELALLEQTFTRTARERSVQLVTVTGEPGMGKSRLVRELRRSLGEQARWRIGRCLPYGEGISFWALGEIVKAEAGILESDDPESSAQKLRQAVEAVAEPAEAQWLERRLSPLVGLSAEDGLAGDHREEAFAAWRHFFEALAEERPLVAVFEDLHFADEGLVDFVDHLVEWASGVPLLVVCTARPELVVRRASWGGGKPNATTLSLAPLSDEETAELVHALLEEPVLEAELRASLVARAGGNPLYAEEFARLLTEGREPHELPESVQGLIAARLDTLPEEEKELIQDAAVIGNVFWLGAATEIGSRERPAAERHLHELERREFLRRERRSSVAGENEYAFRHQLVRDVAYGQIPRGRRADKHRLAAEWIETLGRPEDHAEMIAHHYSAALELARAAGQPIEELATRARLALRKAGERAEGLNAFASAKSLFAAALELWPPGDAERPRLLFAYGKALAIADEAGEDVLREAADALLAGGDRATAAEAEVLIADSAWNRGEWDRADGQLARATALTAELPPSRSTAFVLSMLARGRMMAGKTEEAIRLGRAALELAEGLGLEEIRAQSLDTIGAARVSMGDFRGLADLERSIEIALAANLRDCVVGYNNLGAAYLNLGNIRRGYELMVEGLNAAERFGDMAEARGLRGNLICLRFTLGRWDEAVRLANEFIAETEAGAPNAREGSVRTVRAAIRLARNDAEGALDDAERVLEIAPQGPADRASALTHYGCCLLARGRAQQARTAAEEALAIAREDAVSFGDTWPFLIRVLAAVGRGEEALASLEGAPTTHWIEAARFYAVDDFASAAELYAQIGSLPDEAEARLRAAEQLAEAGRHPEANAQLEQALAFYRSVGATRYISEGEALLAASA